MKWSEALKMYNAGKSQYCMPRRGSPEHAEVLKLMGRVPKGTVSKPAASPATKKPTIHIPSMYDEPGSSKQHVPKVQTAAERGLALSKAREARHRKAESPKAARPAEKEEEPPAVKKANAMAKNQVGATLATHAYDLARATSHLEKAKLTRKALDYMLGYINRLKAYLPPDEFKKYAADYDRLVEIEKTESALSKDKEAAAPAAAPSEKKQEEEVQYFGRVLRHSVPELKIPLDAAKPFAPVTVKLDLRKDMEWPHLKTLAGKTLEHNGIKIHIGDEGIVKITTRPDRFGPELISFARLLINDDDPPRTVADLKRRFGF